MSMTKYPGVPVFLDGSTHLVPSLSLRQVQENYDLLSAPIEVTDENLKAHLAAWIPIIGLAMRSNYPEITDDRLLDMVRIGNFYKLVAIVKGVSGLTEIEPGE